jgi:hypothetical protein
MSEVTVVLDRIQSGDPDPPARRLPLTSTRRIVAWRARCNDWAGRAHFFAARGKHSLKRGDIFVREFSWLAKEANDYV